MGNQLFDQYSYLHFATGVITYFWDISLFQWFVLHTLFEIIENTQYGINFIQTYFWFWPGEGKRYADFPINILGDTIFALLGWYSAYLLDYIGTKNNWYKPHLVKT